MAVLHSIQLISSTQITFGFPRELNIIKILIFVFSLWLSWFLLIPVILKLCNDRPLSSNLNISDFIRYFVYSIVITLAHFAFYTFLKNLLFEDIFSKVQFKRSYRLSLFYSEWIYVDYLVFWGIVALKHVVNYIKELKQSISRNNVQDATISIAKLNSLKSQIRPHFVFNTLNSISTLILKGNQKESSRMISLLGNLLRESIDSTNTKMIVLKDEIAFVRSEIKSKDTIIQMLIKDNPHKDINNDEKHFINTNNT